MSIDLNCRPTPTSQHTVQLAAFKNFADALQLEQPDVSGKQVEAMRYIFQQCAKDCSNAPDRLKQLVSMVNLSEIELLPNGVLQRIFAHTLMHNFRAPLAAVSVKFRENIRDHNVMSLLLELPECQSITFLTLQEIQTFQQAVKKRCGTFYPLAEMLKRLPNVQLDLTDAIIYGQLFDQIIAAGPYLKSLNLSGSTITDKQLAQIAQAAPQLRSLNLTRCQNLRSPHLTGGAALTELYFVGCSSMQNPPILTGLSALTKLSFRDCSQMQNPPVLTGLTALTRLSFCSCSQMKNPPVLTGLTALRLLDIRSCNIRPDTAGLSNELVIL